MKHHKTLLLIPTCLAIFVLFISGQIFYYANETPSSISPARITTNSKLTANLNAALQRQVTLKSNLFQVVVSLTDLKNWTEIYVRDYTGQREMRISAAGVQAYLENVGKTHNTPPINAKLTFTNGKVTEFEPSKPGEVLNIPSSQKNITNYMINASLASAETATVELVFDEIQPDVTLEKVNDLGINELLATGESDFSGSPKFRTHNITVGSKKFTGITVKPREEFSFDNFLGIVDASTGYLPELVIKNGTVTPEYGGGLCQVSTTLFRATTAAGFPILERHPHSFPVHYYNPQGYDATIYPGFADLRFINDTSAYILIQSKIVGSKLYFEIYGTKDGRQVTIDGPHPYDIRSSGAMKATLTRTITYSDGQQKKDVFQSLYKSPKIFPVVNNPFE